MFINGGYQKKKHFDKIGKSLSKKELQERLVHVEKKAKPWLKDVNSQTLLASLFHLNQAFSKFFKKQSGFPKYKKKYNAWQSFQCPQHVAVSFEEGQIDLPKIKGIKAKLHRVFEDHIKTVTIKRTPTGKYFASVLVDEGIVLPEKASIEPNQSLGIDVGLTHALIDSEGHKVGNPKFLAKALSQLAIAQKILSRSKKGSSNRAQRKKESGARVHERVTQRRLDFIHQTTHELAVNNHATCLLVEDLNIKGMVRNRKLARSIHDSGWGRLLSTLEYKCDWTGKILHRIGRFQPSSKLCHECGYKMDKLPLSTRQWTCQRCHQVHDRDINAARNIRDIGLAELLGSSSCVKRSPVTKPVSAGVAAKGVEISQHGSQEAPVRIAIAI